MSLLITRSSGSVGGGGDGSLTHGELVTITGSGFGTRPDYNLGNYTWQGQRHIHYRWTDFASGFPSNGSSQSTFQNALGGWFPGGLTPDSGAFEFNDTPSTVDLTIQNGGPSQSGKYLRKTSSSFAAEGYIQSDTETSGIPSTPEGFICYKARLDGSGKVIRWWNQGGGSPNWYLGNQGAFTREGSFTQWLAPADYNPSSSVFKRFTHLLLDGNACRFWIDEDAVQNDSSGTYADLFTLPLVDGQSSQTIHLTLPNSVDSGGVFEYADIYWDLTPARVEVTGANGKVEIQPCTSWANTSITFVGNKGEMNAGAGTVRVYNSSNTVVHSAAMEVV